MTSQGVTAPQRPARGMAFVFAAAALWGTTGTAQALGPDGVHPTSVAAVRMSLGGALMLALGLRSGAVRAVLKHARRSAPALVCGVVAVVLYQVSFFTAVARTGVAVGTVVAIGSAPVLTGAGSRLMGDGRLSLRWAVSTVAAIASCSVLVLGGEAAGVDAVGILWALLAGACYATYLLVVSRTMSQGLPERGVMGVLFGSAAIVLFPVACVFQPTWLMTPRGLGAALYLGGITTVVSYLLLARGLRTVPPAVASTVGLVEPGVAAVLGVVVLGERLSLLSWLALGALLGSILLLAKDDCEDAAPQGSSLEAVRTSVG